MQLSRFILSLILFIAFTMQSTVYAADKCHDLFGPSKPSFSLTNFLRIKETKTPTEAFSPWSRDRIPKIRAEQILPQDFLEKVVAEHGPVTVLVIHHKKSKLDFFKTLTQQSALNHTHMLKILGGHNEGFSISLVTKNNVAFIDFTIVFDRDNASLVHISNLLLENPLSAKKEQNLHISQSSKGLPYPVFNHVKKQFFDFLKKGSITKIQTDSGQNYAVTVLYRRLVNMKPSHETSEKLYNYLDNLYNFSRKSLPELEIKSVDDFARILEDSCRPSNKFLQDKILWQTAIDQNKIPPEFKLIQDKNNTIIAVATPASRKNPKGNLYFVNPNFPNTFLHWSDFVKDQKTSLQLTLD